MGNRAAERLGLGSFAVRATRHAAASLVPLCALGCQWIVGIHDRSGEGLLSDGGSPGEADAGATGGTGDGATGSSETTAGLGSTGDAGASERPEGGGADSTTGATTGGADAGGAGDASAGDADAHAGDADAGDADGASAGDAGDAGGGTGGGGTDAGAAGDSGTCPAGGFVQATLAWHVKEGDPRGTTLSAPIALNSTAPGDWSVALEGAPAWVSAPSSLVSATSLALEAPAGVPYDAFPGPVSFVARLALKANSSCQSALTVALDVTNVLHAPLADTDLPAGISYAAWHAASESFYLLDSAAGRFYVLDTRQSPPSLSSPRPLAASGTVAPRAFAVSDSRVYAVVNNALYRMGLDGTAQGAAAPIANPAPGGNLSMAWGSGWILLGDDGGPARAIDDTKASFEASTFLSWSDVSDVVSDGSSFAFKTQDGAAWDIWRVSPAAWGAGVFCAALPSATFPPAVSGQIVAWVTLVSGEYLLNFANLGTSCEGADSLSMGTPAFTYRALGLSNGRALVLTNATGSAPQKFDFALFDVVAKAELGERLVGQNSDPLASAVVMGGTRYALIITTPTSASNGHPLLVQL